MSKVEVSGNIKQAFKEATAKIARRVEAGLYWAGVRLLEMSQVLVPKDTEALLESSEIYQQRHGFNTIITVGYGKFGFTKEEYSFKEGHDVVRVPSTYAKYVHEIGPEGSVGKYGHMQGPIHDPPTQADFLTTPMYQNTSELATAFWVGMNT